MNNIEKVKKMCAEKNVSIHKLEMDLGFSNGYISQLKKGIPYEKLKKIAEYFGVPVNIFLDDENSMSNDEEYAKLVSQLAKDPQLMEVVKMYCDIPDNLKGAIYEMLMVFRSQKD